MQKQPLHLSFLQKLAIITVLLTGVAATTTAAEYTDPSLGLEFVQIKGGTFVMGDILRKDKDASPPHRVTVGDFWMSKYEVTFEQYDKFCEATKRDKPDDHGWGRENRPVINVSWKDAVAFTGWLSKKAGKSFRLASEAQWEYAARAGTTTNYWWGQKMEKGLANCYNCGSKWDRRMTAPVGSFRPNPWGIYDMTGNVSEWTFDNTHETYENAPTTDEPWLSGGSNMHTTRGGGYASGVDYLKAHFRDWYDDSQPMRNTGFRVAIID